MQSLERSVDAIARQTSFSGVVRVDHGEAITLARAYGLADRRHEIPNAIDTQFGIASGTKGFTAATVVSLIADYLDEETDLDLLGYLLPVPPHELATTEQYLAVLNGHPSKFLPGARFEYCNSGYVVLALIAERVSGEHYGLGIWLRESSDVVLLEGCDAGVSFRSIHDPRRQVTHTVISNTTAGAWPIARFLQEQLET